MELSKRLAAVAALVDAGSRPADIGTDHAYIPIWLVEEGICQKAFAMDVGKGPLERAREHITGHGLGNYIETRLSDGLGALAPGEADCMIAAGMGGNLIIKILEEGCSVLEEMNTCILQPQSELAKVRKYLCEHGYCSVAENMVKEDGKYYPMMKVRKGCEELYREEEYCYGRLLLKEKHPVLREFLEKERRTKQEILQELQKLPGEHVKTRIEVLQHEILVIENACRMYEQE